MEIGIVEQKYRKRTRAKVQVLLYLMALLIFLLIVLLGCLFVFSKKADLTLTKKQGVQSTSLAILPTSRIKKILQTFSIEKEKDAELGSVIGIDLGSSYSRVGVFDKFGLEIITNDRRNSSTPSWVAFTDTERLIGAAAKDMAQVNAERTIFDFKRFIGRKFDDEGVQKDIKRVPYKFVNKDGKPCIQVKVSDGETKVFSPEEISTMFLAEMKKKAEIHLGKKIRDAVLTVPAYFDSAQSQAIKDAGIMAGLNVVRVISEPIAAAIAHGLSGFGGAQNILVFDLGGRTFDVTILRHFNNKFEVRAIDGDTHLGGDIFDERVVDYFIKLIQEKHGKDIRKDEGALRKLRRECERAKIVLSSENEAHIVVESLFDGKDFSEPFTRGHFEELNDDLFKKTLELVKKAMENAGVEKHQINEIVLVGGSTEIPKVQHVLKDFFNGAWLTKSHNPGEDVSVGASLLGGILNGKFVDPFSHLVNLRLEVTPFALGIETVGDVMTELIPQSTLFPAKGSQIFTSVQDGQTNFTIKVFLGEENMNLTKDCMQVAEFDLTGVTPAQRGTARIEVTAEVDSTDDILHMEAKDLTSGKSKKIKLHGNERTAKGEYRAKIYDVS